MLNDPPARWCTSCTHPAVPLLPPWQGLAHIAIARRVPGGTAWAPFEVSTRAISGRPCLGGAAFPFPGVVTPEGGVSRPELGKHVLGRAFHLSIFRLDVSTFCGNV